MARRVADRREIAERLVRGLSSPAVAVVFDARLVDESEIDALLREAGVDVALKKWKKGDVIVYYIDLKGLWRRCGVEACYEAREEPERTRCLKQCFWESLEGVIAGIAKSLEEVLAQ